MPNTDNTVNGLQATPENQLENHHHDYSYATKELVDSLPQVWTRGLLYFLVIFVIIILPWAMLSKVDETGTASGKLEPQGKTLKLDAPVTAKVALINIKEGDKVKAGQTLVELESDLVRGDIQQQKTKLEGEKQRLSQSQILLNQLLLTLQIQNQQNQAQNLEKLAQVNQAKQNLNALKNSYSLQAEEKQAQVNQAIQNLEFSRTAFSLAQIQLKRAEAEVIRFKNAAEEGIVSDIQIVQKEDEFQERKKIYEQTLSDIEQAKLRLSEQKSSKQRTLQQVKTDIEQAKLQLKEQENSYQSLVNSNEIATLKIQEQIKNLETEITTLKTEIKQTESQIKRLELELTQRIIKAPVAGIIFDLAIDTEGSVVQTGGRITDLAPENTSLILKAQMATTESGSLKENMPVKMKFDSYPFQDYGIIEGKLIKVSPTTSEIETPEGKVAAYDLEIELNQSCIPTPKECLNLRPGDTATAEVIVNQRRIIDFVLDPFKKLQKGGFKL